jgi:lysophospholipase L1-like esterase
MITPCDGLSARKEFGLIRGRLAEAAGVRPVRRSIAACIVIVLASFGLLTSCAPSPVKTMVSTGDSITRGFDACGLFTDCPNVSYATGTDPRTSSLYSQLVSGSPALRGHQINDAEVGARASDLFGQLALAAYQKADVVTVLIGANDACADTVGDMTSTASFRASIESAFHYFFSQRPGAKIVLSSIPDLFRVWQVAHTIPRAQTLWKLAGLCPSLLANPAGTAPADKLRRAFVALQIQKYNAVLAAVCRVHGGCRYDGGAVNRYQFSLSELSPYDYFHPNIAGHHALAELTYKAYRAWPVGRQPAPASSVPVRYFSATSALDAANSEPRDRAISVWLWLADQASSCSLRSMMSDGSALRSAAAREPDRRYPARNPATSSGSSPLCSRNETEAAMS